MHRTTKVSRPATPQLFSEPDAPAGAHVANVDGASRGNPGPASYAVIIRSPDGKTAFQIGKYLGRATNNVAEYYALITALDYALQHRISHLLVRSDSELLVRQMQGRYKVKSPDLRPLYERARKMAGTLAHFAIEHVRREFNADADALANVALDQTSGQAATPKQPAKTIFRERRIKARFRDGVLVPEEALDLPENSQVEVTIAPARHD